MLKVITAAATLAVSVERAKQRLRIDEADDEADIEALIRAAQGVFEHRSGLTLQPSVLELQLPQWPCWPARIQIPAAPVRDIVSIAYLDIDGVEQTLPESGDSFTWARTTEGADIIFVRGFVFPPIFCHPDAVRVQFGAGFDDPASSGSGDDPELRLPPQAELAILFLVGHWFENRESVAGKETYPVPGTFDLLIESLRVFR